MTVYGAYLQFQPEFDAVKVLIHENIDKLVEHLHSYSLHRVTAKTYSKKTRFNYS